MRDSAAEVRTNSQATLSYGRASVERLTRTYLQQICTDTGCSLEDLPEAMDDRDE